MNAIGKVPSELESALRAAVDATTAPFGGAVVTLDYGLDHDDDECLRVVIAHHAPGNPMGPGAANELDYRLVQIAADAGEQRLVYVGHRFHGLGPVVGAGTKRAPQSGRA